MTRKAVLYTDGASRGNPGPAGIGYVLIIDGKKRTHSAYIGRSTNNVAEYTALIEGLKAALSEGVQELDIYMDSELVVRQLEGYYRVKQPHLKGLYEKVKQMLSSFKGYRISHVPRQDNKEADRLSKEAIKGAGRTNP